MPIAPAPTMTIDSGSSRVEDLLLVGDHVLATADVPGSSRVLLPVAMMALSNVTVSVPPSVSSTSMVLASVNVPCPSISVILFFFIRKCTPLTRPSATLRLRSKAAP